MRIFLSSGEPSGDLHASNLVRALRRRLPAADFDGFGGEHLERAGCRLLYRLSDFAVVGVWAVLACLPRFFHFLHLADRYFATRRPDLVILVDYPGFNWWVARRARAHNIPVVYFVPPQLWAWAGWRVHKMRRLVRRALCTLPFEEAWYRDRNVPAVCVGHPYFDELRGQRLDPAFLAEQRGQPGPVVALLPGSRTQELTCNVPSLLRAAQRIHAARPDARFLVACLKPQHKEYVESKLKDVGPLPLEVHAGRTPEIIELCHHALAVSGSVGLELLFRGKPSVVVYRVHWSGMPFARLLMTSRYISLVNLLADKELYPEWYGAECRAEWMARNSLRWLNDAAAYDGLRSELLTLRDRVAIPGACDRAADEVAAFLGHRQARRAA